MRACAATSVLGVRQTAQTKGNRMPELLDHVAYLSREVGPRPAGTEEEQRAALYITEQFQKEARLPAVIEDFSSPANAEIPIIVSAAAAAVAAVLALIVPAVAALAIIVTLVVAVLAVLDVLGRPALAGRFGHSVSQNVVAQYKPAPSSEAPNLRRRKIVLVANYDSGKARFELGRGTFAALPVFHWANAVATMLLPILLIARFFVFVYAEGAVATAFSVVIILAAVVTAAPALLGVAHALAPYNEGANCNASGTAVLIDVATRLGRGLVSEAELAQREDPVIHGEAVAREAGAVPDGTVVEYDLIAVPRDPVIAERSPAERLAAAKAAVAALTGQPVPTATPYDISENLVKVKEFSLETPTEDKIEETQAEAREGFAYVSEDTVRSALESADRPRSDGDPSAVSAASPLDASAEPLSDDSPPIPDWYRKARKKANRADPGANIRQRSRYADPPLSEPLSPSAASPAAHEPVLESEAPESVSAAFFAAPESSSASEEPNTATPDPVEAAAPAPAEPPSAGAAAEPPLAPATPESERPAPAPATPAPALVGSPPAGEAPSSSFEPAAPEPVPEPAPEQPAPPSGDASVLEERTQPFRLVAERAPGRFEDASPAGAHGVPAAGAPLSAGESPRSDAPDPRAAEGSSAVQAEAEKRTQTSRVRAGSSGLGDDAARRARTARHSAQRAQLGEEAPSGRSTAAKNLLSMIPSLSGAAAEGEGKPASGGSAARLHDRAGMRTKLPSLSGSVSRQEALSPDEPTIAEPHAPRSAPPVGTAGMTGAFAPVGEELLKDADPTDIYVDDADDSAYDENFTESGAFAGPGYVEMPTSRVGGFFGRFRRRKKDKKQESAEEQSTAEWLDVDEDFDAREVGRARGGWESFRSDETSDAAHADEGEGWAPLPQDDEWDAIDPWGRADKWEDPGASWDDEEDDEDDDEVYGAHSAGAKSSRRRWRGGAFSRARSQDSGVLGQVGRVDAGLQEPLPGQEEDAGSTGKEDPIAQELRQVYQFRNPDINTEVWFVALGAELAGHGGMRRFIADHAQELRGAIFVELEALGAGELSFINSEGRYRKTAPSSRMGRYASKAGKESGVRAATSSLAWSDSTSSFVISHGMSAIHLAGIEGGKPAFLGEKVDSVDNVDEKKLAQASDFVIGLLKSV